MYSPSLTRTILVGLAVWITMAGSPAIADPPPAQRLRVMTFNMWHGGDAGKQDFAKTVDVVRKSGADVVGLQETHGNAQQQDEQRPNHGRRLAAALGWHYFDQGGRTGIVSRYEIVEPTAKRWGVRVRLKSGSDIYLFNAHLAHAPYQPYQLLKIPYENGKFLNTAAEAVQAARAARAEQVASLLRDVNSVRQTSAPMFVTGDFNEPSHLDWTPAAAATKLCPLAVAWPSSKTIVQAGFVDAFRAIHKDPVVRRGLTWTPITRPDDPRDRHDRIDFVFATGDVKVLSAQVVGESTESADIVVPNYPSDHRAVVVEVALPGQK